MRTPRPGLSAEQLAEAEQIYQTLRQATEDEHWQIAQLLASKPDDRLLGQTEYEVRDLTHATGAKPFRRASTAGKRGVPGVQPKLPAMPRRRQVRRLSTQDGRQLARDDRALAMRRVVAATSRRS